MNNYTLEIKLKSPALVGSGVGFGSEIDTDIVFDEFGLPYIPAKRIKGCLRESITEIKDIFSIAGVGEDKIAITKTFGEAGEKDSAPVYFSNLYLPDWGKNRAWLNYFLEEYRELITPDRVVEYFTEIYQQTKINRHGVAEEHSLRTSRVLKKGLCFEGMVRIESNEKETLPTLLLACQNFRRLGTKRNRGFGEISCQLKDAQGMVLNAESILEELCTL